MGYDAMRSEIVLIGPMHVGKSTIARLLATTLGLPQYSLDAVGWQYYSDAGFQMSTARALRETEGELRSYQYLERFLVPALERHLAESHNGVIDVGAGHTVCWDDQAFVRVQQALAPFRNVILLLPSADLEESAAILRERTRPIGWLARILEQSGVDLNERFLRHRTNFKLAKFIVYTEAKSPEQTRDEILDLVRGRGPGLQKRMF